MRRVRNTQRKRGKHWGTSSWIEPYLKPVTRPGLSNCGSLNPPLTLASLGILPLEAHSRVFSNATVQRHQFFGAQVRAKSDSRLDLFLYFNLCFPLHLFTKRILSVHNGLPLGTLPLSLNAKPKCLCSGKHPDPVHLWIATGRKKLTHPLSKAGYSRRYLQDIWHFYFTFSTPPHLCSIKEPAIQSH